MRPLFDYLRDPHWRRQHLWRRAIWRGMARLGLTGLHVLPVHARWVDIHRRRMPLVGLDPAFEGYRLIQISDLHYSPMVTQRYLRQMIEIINQQRPDLVVATGDLLTGGHQFVHGITALLGHIRATDGVIATFGNHDYTMHGKRKWKIGQVLSDRLEAYLERHQINVLRNERATIRRGDGAITIVGLDDEWTGRLDARRGFETCDGSVPTICLNHNPVNARELLEWPWQWMLAGHTHGRPLEEMKLRGKVVRRGRPFVAGYYEVEPGRHLYVNRGLSYGDRRGRNNRPEITLFRLTRCPVPAAAPGEVATAQVAP
jgi:predicted MPP superfamily phosphohydrolase